MAGPQPSDRLFAFLALLILCLAVVMRLDGLRFGLPALLDADEPIFVLTSLRLLRDHTLNPGWFGHPGTTTIYALAVIETMTYMAWHLVGRFGATHDFAHAMYTDPSIVILPDRIFILVCGLLTILLTVRIAQRLFGARVGLVAALLLAVDPLHIRYSQIIRTDMHATVFVLLEILAAITIVQKGRTRDYLLAALWLGFACATKWPAAAVVAAVVGAAALRWHQHRGETMTIACNLAFYFAGSIAALFMASPYLFLDYTTVLDNLHGEARPFHLGATGYGFLGNLGWYLTGPATTAMGVAGVMFAAAGIWLGSRNSRIFLAILVPIFIVFMAMICAQALIWERWLVPLLPLLTISAALGIVGIAETARARFGDSAARVALLAAIATAILPTLATARTLSGERTVETRQLATQWARAHVAPGETVTIEHLAFDVVGEPWRFLYPVGDKGCVDVRANLTSEIGYSTVGKWRGARPVVDIGTVAPDKLASCRADWAILSNWDRYRAEPEHFQAEIDNYDRYVRDGHGIVVATFSPVRGSVGGRVVRIVRFPSHASQR